jgi:RHS repeat-associated protein
MGRTESYNYDISSNIIRKTDRNGNAISMEYDGMNRLVRVSAAGPGGVTAAERLVNTYTKTGSLRSQENENMKVTYSYDSHGRNIQKSQSNGIVEEFTYNMADQRTSFRLSQGEAEKMRLGYAYDAVGRLRQVNNGGSTTYANYTYDENHNLRSAAYPSPGITATYTYGYANQLTGLSSKKGSTTLSSSAYTYYLDGNQASKSENAVTTEYEYDGVGRLAKESSASGSKAYAYDQAGNRVSLAASGTGGSYSVAYAYDGNNRLIGETKVSGSLREINSYVYDGNGNQIARVPSAISTTSSVTPSLGMGIQGTQASDITPEYRTYDVFGRMTGVRGDFGTASYKYQPDDLRLSKTVNGSTTTHIWDGADMVGEMQSGNISAKYLRGMGLIGSVDSGNTMRYYIHNGHGDTVKLTNSSGTVTRSYAYDAFGVSAGTAGDTNPFRYAGEYFDTEIGTYYLRARSYNPATGRFTQEDPARAGLNWYTYCSNNPIAFIDPWGLVEVGLRAYAETYKGSTVSWDQKTGTASVTWNGKTLSVASTADNNRDGRIYIDDSLFVNTFGNGNDKLVVYQDGVTGNVSIRANLNISGDAAEQAVKTKRLFYKTHFLQGIEEYWSGTFGEYEVSTYARESTKGIKVDIGSGNGTSSVRYGLFGWSKSSPGSMTMDILARSGSGEKRTVSDFRWTAAHEFGHILGVGDAYNSQNSTGVTSIMNKRGVGVQAGDIVMVLNAWNTSKFQNWP